MTPVHVSIGGAFWLDTSPAASFQRLQAKLRNAFGFGIILSTRPGLPGIGAGRTPAEEQLVNPGGPTNSDHVLGRAIDINNHQRFRDVAEELFIATLESEGWVNVDVSGEPFTREPWHWARRGIIPTESGSSVLDNGNTITQAQRYWRNTMSEGFARGDSATPITLPDKTQVPASALVYAIDYGTGTRRYEKHEGVVLNWLAVVGLSAVPQLTQAQLDGIPKTPGSIDWDGHTVGADGK